MMSGLFVPLGSNRRFGSACFSSLIFWRVCVSLVSMSALFASSVPMKLELMFSARALRSVMNVLTSALAMTADSCGFGVSTEIEIRSSFLPTSASTCLCRYPIWFGICEKPANAFTSGSSSSFSNIGVDLIN